MQHKRLTLFAGHYGSGKTNIAVNYALHLAKEGKSVVIADLDIGLCRGAGEGRCDPHLSPVCQFQR